MDQLRTTLRNGPCVLVTIMDIRGSAPREIGSHMMVTAEGQWGSIGGGNLEYQSSEQARNLLAAAQQDLVCEQRIGLGPALNQCCGGSVSVLFELFVEQDYPWLEQHENDADGMFLVTALNDGTSRKWLLDPARDWPGEIPSDLRTGITRQLDSQCFVVTEFDGKKYIAEDLRSRCIPLALFGAGHVARALVPMLGAQPFDLHWIDDRNDAFPANAGQLACLYETTDPAGQVHAMPPGTAFLVMTHSHELDENICNAVLERGDARWLGLIGSQTKRRRFEHRLAARGHAHEALARLVCPVGLAGIPGKRPATIAVTIIAQLLRDCVPEQWR